MHEDAIAELGLGALTEIDAPEVPDGPRAWHRGAGVIAWAGTEARIGDEVAGVARGGAHPLAPRIVRATPRAIALAGTGEEIDAIEALVASAPREVVRSSATIGAHLAGLGGPVSLGKALARAVGRSRADRLLARSIEIATGRGPVLGGIDPRWIRTGERGPIALSMRRSAADGWAALDLAAADVAGLADLREAHAALGGDDAAYDLALLAVALREHVIAKGEAALERAREVIERLAPRDAARVRVRIAEGPSWLPRERWEGEVALAQARWLVRELDGLRVGGETVRVACEPSIRAGRAAPAWRPRGERRRELFSRWDEGVRADEEGLYSATPEALAEEIAEGARGVAIDATCGAGSIAIALARRREVTRVIAIDRDAARLEMARHNAAIYGVADRIDFRCTDALELVPRLRGDVLVIDPPWGGRGYDRERVGVADLGMDVRPLIASFAGAITLKLPRSFAVSELGEGWSISAGVDRRGVIKLLIARRG